MNVCNGLVMKSQREWLVDALQFANGQKIKWEGLIVQMIKSWNLKGKFISCNGQIMKEGRREFVVLNACLKLKEIFGWFLGNTICKLWNKEGRSFGLKIPNGHILGLYKGRTTLGEKRRSLEQEENEEQL